MFIITLCYYNDYHNSCNLYDAVQCSNTVCYKDKQAVWPRHEVNLGKSHGSSVVVSVISESESESYIFIFLAGGLLKSVEGTPARNIENCPHNSVSCRRKVLRAFKLLQAWLWFSRILSMSRTSVWAWETAELSADYVVKESKERRRERERERERGRERERERAVLVVKRKNWWAEFGYF